LLEDEFPEVYRFVTSVYPSGEDDVITSPYNSVLAMKELNEHADCVLPIENEVRNNTLFLSVSFFITRHIGSVSSLCVLIGVLSLKKHNFIF